MFKSLLIIFIIHLTVKPISANFLDSFVKKITGLNDYSIGNSTEELLKIKSIKNIHLCDLREIDNYGSSSSRKDDGQIMSSLKVNKNKICSSDSLNFSFSAKYNNQDLKRFKHIKLLEQALSLHSTCQVNYLKYNQTNQRLEYLDSNEASFWYENKRINSSFSPQVMIIKDEKNKDRRVIIFKCSLPISDVESSIWGPQSFNYKSIQSYPVPENQVTISGFHVKLHFEQVDNININLRKGLDLKVLKKLGDDDLLSNSNFIRNRLLNQKSSERFLIYFDGKCKMCNLIINNQTTLFDPLSLNSIKCQIKANTCEHNGKCLLNKEIYTPLNYVTEQEKPFINMFVCNSDMSQTNLYMPCSINNGNCKIQEKCKFNAITFNTTCE